MKLYVVGFGAGKREGMTLEALNVIENCDIIVGYTVYAELIKKQFPQLKVISTPMRKEVERVKLALEIASKGKSVALVCSGDSSVYALAGLVLELSVNYPDVTVEVVPGVTAALSGGAVLGAPLTHDFAVISLSDLLTPWEKIEKRLKYAAIADFTIVIYNPTSKKRYDYLRKACEIILLYKSPETICGIVKNIGRAEEAKRIMTLNELKETAVDMFTTVFIGNADTKVINGRMVTPRGYRNV